MDKSIVYTQRVEIIESYGERRDCADQRIPDFIRQCGFVPFPVPNDPDIAEAIVEGLKPAAIVLTGGNSLVKYGGNAPERDSTDKRLIELAIRNSIPLYGFCRGMQSILDHFGNELVNVEGHVATRHELTGDGIKAEVNSYHNQACVHLDSDELETVMTSSDGVIEMVRHKCLPIVGTMWHPEREDPYKETDMTILKNLLNI